MCAKYKLYIHNIQEADFSLPLDNNSVKQKIRCLMNDEGIKSCEEVQLYLDKWKKRVFPESAECSERNHRFNPTRKDMQNHISAALYGRLA